MITFGILNSITGVSDAIKDDQFDSTALVSLGFDDRSEVSDEDFVSDLELEELWESNRRRSTSSLRRYAAVS